MLESLCGFGFGIGTSLVYSFPQQAGRQAGWRLQTQFGAFQWFRNSTSSKP